MRSTPGWLFDSTILMDREVLNGASRLVVKLGTGVLTDARKQLDLLQMRQLVDQLAACHQSGKEVAIVTSGAVGAGMGVLGYERRPTSVSELQACAAVGQTRLMTAYETLFARRGIAVAQVLLTHEDLEHHDRHLNARNTLVTLLGRRVIPVINENDAVSVTELKFGDNDKLSALVAALLPADLLLILTTVDGLIEQFGTPSARVLATIDRVDSSLELLAGGTDSPTAVGGMASKIQAAKIAMRSGIPLVIASGRRADVMARVMAGEPEGTLFRPQASRLRGRKRWIGFFHHPRGSLVVDEGARKALREKGKSLLPPGIVVCEGDFKAGDVVRVTDRDGMEFARGIAAYDAVTVRSGKLHRTEVVHRDNLVIL